MKPRENYQDLAVRGDLHDTSYNRKSDLILLIKKFLVNEDGSTPAGLKKLDKRQLYMIWMKNKPAGVFNKLIYWCDVEPTSVEKLGAA